MHMLFNMLEERTAVAQRAWHLLQRLPPSPVAFVEILNNPLLANHPCRLLYNLHIADYLMNATNSVEQLLTLLEGYEFPHDETAHLKETWTARFV